MGGRTVQKYIEYPLLAPIPTHRMEFGASDAGIVKFDTRVWVLVSSFDPLTAYIYPTIYGRRCGTPYSVDLTTLTDGFTHLTNYSVQKKIKMTTNGSNKEGSSKVVSSTEDDETARPFDAHAARKLRNVIKTYRTKSSNSNSSISGKSSKFELDSSEGQTTDQHTTRGGKLKVADSDLLMSTYLH